MTASGVAKQEGDGVKPPRVSVIAIFLNGERYLVEAIESVVAQTFDRWEFLLVDDGSGPAATAIAKDYVARYPSRLRYLEHPGHANRGMSATRNLGIRHARGQYIAFIDADDCWLPSKLSEQVTILDAHPEVGMAAGSVVYWNSWAGGIDTVVPTGHAQDVVVPPPEAMLALYPLGRATSPCPSDIILRTELARSLGGFEERFTGMYEDQAFLAKVYLASPVYFASSIWLKYREHPESCVATVIRAGGYDRVREYFLEWLEAYLKTRSGVDPRVQKALRKAVRRYRHPFIHALLRIAERVRSVLRPLRGSVLRRRAGRSL
jgi:glycosyltransferase involved in cell wall biosynthesis